MEKESERASERKRKWERERRESVQVHALNPPHAVVDGLINKGFFVYFHPIEPPAGWRTTRRRVASLGDASLIDYKIATRSLVIGGLSVGD